MRLTLILVLSVLFSVAQDEPRYSFIKYETNRISFSKDSSAFMKFYEKLDSFSQKKRNWISVVHIGGSHVQGGTWSNTFAGILQEEFKPAGGGYFVFPYKLAKTNSPHYAKSFSTGNWKKCRCIGKDFCLPLGMSGLSVSSNDSANKFGMALTKKSLFQKFNCMKVYHNFNPSFEFKIDTGLHFQVVRTDKKELGYTQFDFEKETDSVSFELVRKDTLVKDFVLFGFSMESNKENGLYLAALGANGAASGSFLKCDHFVDQLRTISPDLVILSLGVNDTQAKDFGKEDYIEHYDSLIMKIREASPGTAILLTTTTDNFIRRRTPNKRPIKAQEAMIELMNKHHVAVWDMYTLMGGYKSIMKWQKAGLASRDRVHFSPKGYTILGKLMAEAVLQSYRYNIKTKP